MFMGRTSKLTESGIPVVTESPEFYEGLEFPDNNFKMGPKAIEQYYKLTRFKKYKFGCGNGTTQSYFIFYHHKHLK